MPKPNIFKPRLIELWAALAKIEFAVQNSDVAIEMALKVARKKLEESDGTPIGEGLPVVLGSGSCLSVLNVFDESKPYFGFGRVRMHDQELMDLFTEQSLRANGQALVLAYEDMEHFLKQFCGDLYYHGRGNQFNVTEKKQFEKQKQKYRNKNTQGLPEYYSAYAEWRGQSNSNELLSDLRASFSAFDDVCSKSWIGYDLVEFYQLIAKCRHSIVHFSGRVTQKMRQNTSKWQQDIVNQMLKKSVLTGYETILPEKQHMMSILERISGLSWAIYKTVSLEFDFDLG